MKKRTYITLFLWAAALLSGCTGDEEIVGGQSVSYTHLTLPTILLV